jgi:hypothetical protein
VAKFTSREDLETRIGRQRVLELFDDDRDGVLNDDEMGTLNELASEADDTTTAALLQKAWTNDQLTELARDRSLRRATTQIFAQLAGERRPEFRNDADEGPYDAMGERGRETLQRFSRGQSRSRLEPAVGANKSLRGRYSPSEPKTIMGRDVSDPNDRMGDDKGF